MSNLEKNNRESNSSSCHGKIKFRSYTEAMQRYRHVSNSRFIKRTSRRRDNLHAYRCLECHTFHLGHESPEMYKGRKRFNHRKEQLKWEVDKED